MAMKEIKRIRKNYQDSINAHVRGINDLVVARNKEIRKIQDTCDHVDDYCFMHGFCKKCGKFLE